MNPIVYTLVLIFGIVFLTFPIAVPVLKSSADMSIFNTNWNGLSNFAKLVSEKREIVPILYPYNNVRVSELRGVLLIVSPSIDFSSSEAEELKRFLEKGGTVFIADDSGIANTLLEKIGVRARFSKDKVKDLFYSKNENFPIVLVEDENSGKFNLTLNAPSVILGVKGEISTSRASVLKEMGEYTIFADLKYGNGRIFLFSDPSALMNEMLNENMEFALNLIEILGNGTFYFDEAHRLDLNPYSVGTVYIHRELDRNSAFVLILLTASFALLFESGLAKFFVNKVSSTFEIFRRRIVKEEIVKEDLPEWVDREKLKKMLERMGVEYGETGKGDR